MHVVDELGRNIHECDKPEHGDHYWRRNIFGMGGQLDMLAQHGMAFNSNAVGQWPEQPDGLEWGDDDELVGPGAAEYNAAMLDYLKSTEVLLDENGTQLIGIPVHKFSSNDGWWVTKAECLAALVAWEKAGRPVVDKFGDHEPYNDTIPFLCAAADHDGFRVY
jgi:hypothetical protein